MDSRRKVIILFILSLIVIEIVWGQIQEPIDFFKEKLNQAKGRGYCKENEYQVGPIYELGLKSFKMYGWLKKLEEQSRKETIFSPGAAGSYGRYIDIYCINKEKFDREIQPLLEKQIILLSKLVYVYTWAKKILVDTQYGLIDKFISNFWGDPNMSEPLEELIDKTNICVEIVRAFLGRSQWGDQIPTSLVDRSGSDYVRGLINEGLATGIVSRVTETTYVGPAPGGSGVSVNIFYKFNENKIKNQIGDVNYNKLIISASQFVKDYESLVNTIRKTSKSIQTGYSQIPLQKSLDDFEKAVNDVNKNIETFKNNYMIGVREETTCNHFLAVIIKGKTEAGKDSNQFINDILNPQLEASQELQKNLMEAARIMELPPEIKVATTEISIAVIPPIIFDGEHKGTSSLAAITPSRIFDEIKDFLFKLAPTIFTLLLVIGAIFYLLTPINLQNIQKGTEYIKWAVLGYFLLLVVSGIITAIRAIFGGPGS